MLAQVTSLGQAEHVPRSIRLLTRYPVITLTVIVGLIVLALDLAEFDRASRWVATLYVSAFIVWTLVGMVRDVMRGHVGLDVLAVVAMVATLAVGEYVAALIIVLMLSGGEALEDYASRRAKKELTALLDRSPQIAHVIVRPGDTTSDEVRDAAADDVRIGDVLLVRPSEIVPVDGMLLTESGSFDESSLTGESMPVSRGAGDEVLSGAVNGSRAVRIRAVRRSADSQYQQIVALVRDAQESRAPVVRLADRFAIPFTAVSLVIAGAAWGISGDPTRFAEVLVLATPCPLLIAAPVAFLGGLSRAAKAGIIIKGGAVIEQLARVRSAAFDKTGTLTQGRPDLVEVRAAAGFDADEVLRLAASAEQYSTHVLAEGIRRAAHDRGLTIASATEAREVATNGVTATIGGRTVVVGKPAYVASLAPDTQRADLDPGQAAAYVAIDGRFAGVLVLADDVRPESRAVVTWLREHGVERIVMLTGDAHATAESIAHEVGITDVHAELLPPEKVHLAAAAAAPPRAHGRRRRQRRPRARRGRHRHRDGRERRDGGGRRGRRGDPQGLAREGRRRRLDRPPHAARRVRRDLDRHRRSASRSCSSPPPGVIPAVAGALIQELVDLATILYALRALTGPPSGLDVSGGDARGRA